MNIFKKVSASLTAAVILVSSGLTSSADSIYDTAEEIYCGEQISDTIYHWEYADDKYPNDFKITSTSEGELVLSIYANQEVFSVYVYDSNGDEIPKTKNDIKIGRSVKPGTYYHWCAWNDVTEVFDGKLIYTIGKGTYYIRITQGQLYGNAGSGIHGSGDFTLTAFFPDLTDETADVNNDGAVNARDALYILKLALKGEKSNKYDVNHDGYVNAKDALAILKYAIYK